MRLVFALVCLQLGAVLLVDSLPFSPAKINLSINYRVDLENGRNVNVWVTFHQSTQILLQSSPNLIANLPISAKSRGEQIKKLTVFLKAHAQFKQSSVAQFLTAQGIQFRAYWISNQIYVKNVSTALIQTLTSFPEVATIEEDKIIKINDLFSDAIDAPMGIKPDVTWGLERMEVPKVWNMVNGSRGSGIIVGGIDTGVRGSHEALRDNWVGPEYGWMDPIMESLVPVDEDGHGTHTIGTAVGKLGIGVAPDAEWMACRGCHHAMCSSQALLACGEYMLCPTQPDGSNPDCSKAPHIVVNSWGGGAGNTWYHDIIEAWVACGIFPVFANGNSGPYCASANSPADNPLAFAVGNTQEDDGIYIGSSRGPALSGLIKPDVSAPGTNVYSANPKSDSSYSNGTGTSMACPHVAGVAALLLSHKSDLTIPELRQYLLSGNKQVGLMGSGQSCGYVSETTFPNNIFGNGRISAVNSYRQLLNDNL